MLFDDLEDMIKARKAKGLGNWKKLEKLANKLAGKHSKDITFTCGHPSHGVSGEKHNLGSKTGNLHFLLGYVNPGFHVAPYHWQILYPEMPEEDIVSLSAASGHPAKPNLWEESNLDVVFEGDLEDGQPHHSAHLARSKQDIKDRSIKAKSRYNSYLADPAEGLIYESGTERVYKWELVQNSFFAYENPEIVEAMEDAKPEAIKKSYLPEIIQHMISPDSWDAEVYPLVKSTFPKPGSVVTISTGQETIYGLIRSGSLDLVDSAGQPVEFEQYGRMYKSLDLYKGGDINPSILYNFATRYLHTDGDHLKQLIKSQYEPPTDVFPQVVHGLPSSGYEDIPSEYSEDVQKSVELINHTYRLRIEK